MKKILLLNPPGKKLYIRDYYCSKVSKSNYLFEPTDLFMLSGILSEHFDVYLIDAIADKLGEEDCLNKIEAISPDAVISLIGAISLEEDLNFLSKIKRAGRLVAVSGDVTLENTKDWLAGQPFIDAVIMDFTSFDIVYYLQRNYGSIKNMTYRLEGQIRSIEGLRPVNEEFALPIPRHELFTSKNYNFPFVRSKNFATVLTEYGCPFKCSFCIMSTIGHKFRNLENIIAELKYLSSMGKKEIFFMDQSFGVNADRTLALCRRMRDEGLNFGWVCFSRVDIINENLVKSMKQAGCHTIIFGVESASEEILKNYKKGYDLGQIREAFELCRKNNIRTVATFILGLPEETEKTVNETIEFLKDLDCDFVSFNIAVPRMNTPLRKQAVLEGLISPDLKVMDQGGSFVTMPTKYLTIEQVQNLKKKAVRKFYLRPAYLYKRLTSIRSFYELKEQVSEGLSLFKDL